jgi:hypothetical protein
VIHVRRSARDCRPAVEAPATLEIHQDRSDKGQVVPLTPEQEVVEVGRLAEHVKVLLTHVP